LLTSIFKKPHIVLAGAFSSLKINKTGGHKETALEFWGGFRAFISFLRD